MQGSGKLISVDLLITHASELITVSSADGGPKCGRAQGELGIIPNGAVAARGSRIVAVGPTEDVRRAVRVDSHTTVIDASGKTVMPGFVDPHTHIVYGGTREFELGIRLQGRSYLEILQEGGGILYTVEQTRRSSPEELAASARRRLDTMLSYGTTTAEVKSGYGLSTEDEIKTLEVVRTLDQEHPIRLVPTFLGAHAIPPEYRERPDAFVDLVVNEMIPEVGRRGLAKFCDVFCETGVFSVDQSRRILEAGRQAGMEPKLHADEIHPSGGAELAAELRAVSADHLVHASPDGIRRMAEAGVVAVLLPATTLFLMGEQFAPARAMIEAGVPVAVATDSNPGSSPTESMPLVIALACLKLRLTPAEAIVAATLNAAHAIGLGSEVGSLEVGKQADIIILDAPNHQFVPYKLGMNLVETVIIGGKVVRRGRADT